VYAVLSVCCTWRMLHLAYAALGVNSWWWHGEMKRADLTLCSSNDGRVVDEEERDGGWRWERYGEYELTWEISGTTCLIGLRRPRIGVLPTGSGLVPGTLGMVNWLAYKILSSPSFSCWFPWSLLISLSCAQLYHHLRTRSSVIPLYLSMLWSRLNT